MTARAGLLDRREIALEPLATVGPAAARPRHVHGPREGKSVLLHVGVDLGGQIFLQYPIADPIPARYGPVDSEERTALTRLCVRRFAVLHHLIRPSCKLGDGLDEPRRKNAVKLD